MISKGADSDVNVISLVGERGRELREFVEIIRTMIGENEASISHKILEDVLNNQ